MADVSLDDLIKKDKTKGKVDKLRQVHPLPPRNSRLRNLSDLPALSIIKIEVIGGQEIMCLTKIGQSKSVLKIIVATEGTTEMLGTTGKRGNSRKDAPSQQLRRRRKERSSSALLR